MAHTAMTYRADLVLASLARDMRAASQLKCRLSGLVLMSDPRLKDLAAAVQALPKASAVIYRHFGAADKQARARALRQICFARNHQFLIGNDPNLAVECGADGVHFAQRDMDRAELWRRRCPDWIITAATHDAQSLNRAGRLPLDAVTLSPVFTSQSPSAHHALGVKTFEDLCRQSRHPVIALGGISRANTAELSHSGASGLAGVSGILNQI